jgi:hypothetical protein
MSRKIYGKSGRQNITRILGNVQEVKEISFPSGTAIIEVLK